MNVQMADLTVIPDKFERLVADTDFRDAMMFWRVARHVLRVRDTGHQFIHRRYMRDAIRHWKHYKRHVRKAGQ